MTMTGPLRPGAVQVVSPSTGEILGYAFTVESGRGQMQRWLLFKDPENALEIRPPVEAMARWTLAEWQSNVPKLWRAGSFYVWAQADVYHHGGTYGDVTWTQIPRQGLDVTYPKVSGMASVFQLDPTPWRVLDLHQGEQRGVVYSVAGLKDPTNVEYWMTPPNYQPAGGASIAKVLGGSEEADSVEAFVDVANRSWMAGSSFTIIGCINYKGPVAPAAA